MVRHKKGFLGFIGLIILVIFIIAVVLWAIDEPSLAMKAGAGILRKFIDIMIAIFKFVSNLISEIVKQAATPHNVTQNITNITR